MDGIGETQMKLARLRRSKATCSLHTQNIDLKLMQQYYEKQGRSLTGEGG
jgi:hypothetical protein